MDTIKELSSWCSEMKTYATPSWDALPDLDLYMDQVITYLERQMRLFAQDDEEKLITPSMINNYVKNEIIPRPSQKKYSRVHLAYLLAISLLKQVLPIPDISGIIASQAGNMEMSELFDKFRAIQDEAFHTAAIRVDEAISSGKRNNSIEDMGMFALKLTFEANADILAAKKILHALSADTPAKSDEKKKKTESAPQDEKKKKVDSIPQEDKKKRAESKPQNE